MTKFFYILISKAFISLEREPYSPQELQAATSYPVSFVSVVLNLPFHTSAAAMFI